MAVLSPFPKMSFVDQNGNPLVGGKLYTYVAGTTTPQATYTDSTGTTPNTNPVVMDSLGQANVWLGGAIYKFLLTNAGGATIWTVDNISAPTAAVSPVLSGSVTIDSNTSTPALKITQTGVGPALRVQDSTDPDATPFLIDSTGQVGIGTAAPSAALEIASPGVFKGAWAYMPTGTAVVFFQAAAPTGWTKVTTVNDKALRVVSGATGGATGGAIAWSTAFSGSGTVGSTVLTVNQIPSHTHTYVNGTSDPGYKPDGSTGPAGYNGFTGTTAATGGGLGHDHTLPNLQYADVIICTKD
jgi:hypothetical protein